MPKWKVLSDKNATEVVVFSDLYFLQPKTSRYKMAAKK